MHSLRILRAGVSGILHSVSIIMGYENSRMKRKYWLITVALLIAAVFTGDCILGFVNYRRCLGNQKPVLTFDVLHRGGGNQHYGVTYKIATSLSGISFESWMPFVQNRKKEIVQALPAASQSSEQADWPVFRGGQAFAGVSTTQIPNKPTLIWTFKTGDSVLSSAVIADGVVFAGSMDEHLYAIRLTDGKEIWKYKAADSIEAPPFVCGDVIYVSDMSGVLYALNAEKGDVQWSYSTGKKITGSANGITDTQGRASRIVVGSHDKQLHCVDAATGKKIWIYETENYINGSPAILNNQIVFGGCDAYLHVVGFDGRKIATIKTGSYIAGSAALVNGQAFVGNYGNQLLCADIENESIEWRFGDEDEGSPFFSSPAVTRNRVIAGSRDNKIYCVNATTGKGIWSFATRDQVDSSPVICGDRVIAASCDSRIYILSLNDGKMLWSYQTGGEIKASPAVASGMIVIGSDDGMIYAFGDTK